MFKSFLPVLLVFFSFSAFGQLLEPVKWTQKVFKLDDLTFELVFEAKIDDGWKIYSAVNGTDGDVIPVEIWVDAAKGTDIIHPTKELGDLKTGFDKVFEAEISYFKKSAKFVQTVKVLPTAKELSGFLTFVTCDDKQCLPPTDVEFNYAIEDILKAGSISSSHSNDEQLEETNNSGWQKHEKFKHALFDGDKILDQKVKKIADSHADPAEQCREEKITSTNWFATFIKGFIGGLAAIIMPCVFPMIPLTVSYFTKGSKDKKSGIKNGIIFGLSIIFLYVGLGLLITAVAGADALQQLSTDWIANTFFFVLFVVFALSFFGLFEITLPSSWSTKTDNLANQGGLLGIFFMAFTLALVSFSCTGPIIGVALVESASSALGPAVVMLGFSVALALPFGLFAAFPALLNSMPRSGGWMNSVKIVLGFLELALALKFLSVADMTKGWGFLRYELFAGLWVIIFGLTTLYLAGLIKFPSDSPIRKFSIFRWLFIALFGFLTVYSASGFIKDKELGIYKTPSLFSGLFPPATYNFFIPEAMVDANIKEKYPSYSKCANNINCFKDYSEGLAFAKSVDKPVFIDFTGHGCVNCRKVEDNIWNKPNVRRRLNDDYVLISLYTDERKKLPQKFKSKNTDQNLRNIGNLWGDFQISNFEQNSQPLYVLMTNDEEVITKPTGYNVEESWQDYEAYLKCGLDYNTKVRKNN